MIWARGAMPEIFGKAAPNDHRADVGVAGCGRGGVGAVALVVAGGVELVGIGADERRGTSVSIWRAPINLLLQVNGASLGFCGGVAEVARVADGRVERLVRRERAVVGEARVLRPDAGVDDADDRRLRR